MFGFRPVQRGDLLQQEERVLARGETRVPGESSGHGPGLPDAGPGMWDPMACLGHPKNFLTNPRSGQTFWLVFEGKPKGNNRKPIFSGIFATGGRVPFSE